MFTIRWEFRQAHGFHGYRKKDGPDMSGANQAALDQAKLSKEVLDWYKAQYAEQAPERAYAAEQSHKASDLQLQMMQQQADQSQQDRDFANTTFRPLETQIAADAQSYDTEGRRESEASSAIADVQSARSAQRAATMRDQASMGVNPNSGRAAALDAQGDVMAAAASAGAANKARKDVELQGHARLMDAANLGRGIASAQATTAGLASSMGTAGAGTGGMGLSQAQGATGMVGQGFGQAMQGNAQAGQMFNQIAQTKAQYAGSEMQALGQLAGAGASLYMMSDENVKSDVTDDVSDDEALDAAVKVGNAVKRWKYDPAKGGPDDGGQEHVGAMAQDINKHMGEGAAPGGKTVDPISLHGYAMKGIAALNAKVDKAAKAVSQLARHIKAGGIPAGAAA